MAMTAKTMAARTVMNAQCRVRRSLAGMRSSRNHHEQIVGLPRIGQVGGAGAVSNVLRGQVRRVEHEMTREVHDLVGVWVGQVVVVGHHVDDSRTGRRNESTLPIALRYSGRNLRFGDALGA